MATMDKAEIDPVLSILAFSITDQNHPSNAPGVFPRFQEGRGKDSARIHRTDRIPHQPYFIAVLS
jgi:hypothetical protein